MNPAEHGKYVGFLSNFGGLAASDLHRTDQNICFVRDRFLHERNMRPEVSMNRLSLKETYGVETGHHDI